ncbi:MAG TPA: phosphate regulon sensor histidine kinase PhoR [Steroidobacteraceae bacterium]|nr:phosphate regulon sensor histidine kinase PhoR [Steroidobacteraceae bacterium]
MSPSSWWDPLARAALVAGAACLAGLLIGHVALAVALALAVMLARQLYMLAQVRQWLRSDRVDLAPDAGGAWGEAIGLIGRLFRRKQYHKRRMLQLLRELRSSTAAIADGVVMLNPAAEILWFNRAAARLLHLRGRTDIGLRVDNLVRRPEFVEYLRSGNYAVPVIVQAGGLSDQYLHFQIVPYGAGQLLLMVRDVTQQARLEEMRKDFVANASHELRSPLTVISGYLETLSQDESIAADLRGPIDAMRRQALRMTAIVHDLLELSRLEAEEAAPTGEPVDVGGLLARLRSDLLARLSETRDVQIVIDSSDRLLGVEAQLHSAFGNLLENAVKYTAADGTIAMRWWRDEHGGHLAVRDTGIGIAAAHIPRLTERFYRVDPGRSRASGGSGLGLAIVKHVLQRHGARLLIESEEGKGSTFSCHFLPARLVPPA